MTFNGKCSFHKIESSLNKFWFYQNVSVVYQENQTRIFCFGSTQIKTVQFVEPNLSVLLLQVTSTLICSLELQQCLMEATACVPHAPILFCGVGSLAGLHLPGLTIVLLLVEPPWCIMGVMTIVHHGKCSPAPALQLPWGTEAAQGDIN